MMAGKLMLNFTDFLPKFLISSSLSLNILQQRHDAQNMMMNEHRKMIKMPASIIFLKIIKGRRKKGPDKCLFRR
jgi:hypothetical protein